jgi:UDP-N-acetyl-D-glucosamine dehydrogenase
VFDELLPVEGVQESDLTEVLENTYRSINIALVNEFALIAHELDINVWSVVDAAATKPFGFASFEPGPGVGGHCLPIDPLYLSWAASQQNVDTQFIDLADDINRTMPEHVISRVIRLLNDRGLAVSRSSILVVGVAYKPNVNDVRESPAYDIVGELERLGADLRYHDPHVPEFKVEGRSYESVSIDAETLANQDCVVLVTDHDDVDVNAIVERAPLVFDGRNATDGTDATHVHRL